MAETIKLQTKRDAKEKDIASLMVAVNAQESGFKFNKALYEKRLAQYQEWKIEHKIKGIKY